MVFSTTTLFKNIPCPESAQCTLTNCIYSHDLQAPGSIRIPLSQSDTTKRSDRNLDKPDEPVLKRRKVTYESLDQKPPSRADLIRNQLASQRSVNKAAPAALQQNPSKDSSTASGSTVQAISSLTKPVSPPPAGNSKPSQTPFAKGNDATETTKDAVSRNSGTQRKQTESLNPRLIPNDPAGHARRALYLKYLHAEMTALDKKLRALQDSDARKKACLSEQNLVRMALDEEEKIARAHSSVYANVVKQRIAGLRKMPEDQWVKQVETWTLPAPEPPKKDEKPIVTELSPSQEILILPHLVVSDQQPLAAHGYVPKPPTAEEAAEAAAGVEASWNYEQCDRCSARFQVFPDRNEEGLIAANGPCMYHPLRKFHPPKSKADKDGGSRGASFPCCGAVAGTLGCTRNEQHVFKISSSARLAAVLPFITTPENLSPKKDRQGREVKAVTFDCEMGYTAFGMEVIRLTAVSWPYGEELLDVLVRPLGPVIDLNSRFSGVFPEHFKNGIPYDEWKASPPPPPSKKDQEKPRLPVAGSPQMARELLCKFLTPQTPLIGHAIDNDLNVIRLCHPTIIDTVISFPHPRGLPLRLGLKMLARTHLGRFIQTGGERGHDSLEDSVTTGDLVRVKVGEKWKLLRATGWRIVNDQLIAPPPRLGFDIKPIETVEQTMENEDDNPNMRGQKRKAELDGADGGGDDGRDMHAE